MHKSKIRSILVSLKVEYSKTTIVERILHAIVPISLLIYLIDYICNIEYVSGHVIYWALIFSGNWAGQKEGISTGELSFAILVAIFLNLITIAGVVTGAVKIIKMERQMKDSEIISLSELVLREKLAAFVVRLVNDRALADSIRRDETGEIVREQLGREFAEAHSELLKKYIPIAVPDKSELQQTYGRIHDLHAGPVI